MTERRNERNRISFKIVMCIAIRGQRDMSNRCRLRTILDTVSMPESNTSLLQINASRLAAAILNEAPYCQLKFDHHTSSTLDSVVTLHFESQRRWSRRLRYCAFHHIDRHSSIWPNVARHLIESRNIFRVSYLLENASNVTAICYNCVG